MIKKDCFAYLYENKCVALREKTCDGCGFYKTAEQVKTERENTKRRIESLSSDQQLYIADKYGHLKFG